MFQKQQHQNLTVEPILFYIISSIKLQLQRSKYVTVYISNLVLTSVWTSKFQYYFLTFPYKIILEL